MEIFSFVNLVRAGKKKTIGIVSARRVLPSQQKKIRKKYFFHAFRPKPSGTIFSKKETSYNQTKTIIRPCPTL